MKFFDSVGGRKSFGFIVIAAMAFAGMWFGKLSPSGFETVILGDFAVFVGGNLGDYLINKPSGGKKK
jgi:hypothetical protein